MKIYYFDRAKNNYNNIHSFVMEKFGKSYKLPCLNTPEFFIIQSDQPINNMDFFREEEQKNFPRELSKSIYLESHVAFDNRHQKGIKARRKKLYPQQALKKFCQLTGLELISDDSCNAQFLGIHIEPKFTIMNAFKIEGLFKILDIEKFNRALCLGVGSRKTYGFGLILVKENLCHQ